MKMYCYNGGWQGSMVCVASSKDEAFEKFKEYGCLEQFDDFNKDFIGEHNLDYVFVSYGDC